MSKLGLLTTIVALTSICSSFCVGILVMFAPDAPKRSFPVEELLIDENIGPSENWMVTDRSTNSPCVEGPGDEAWISIRPQYTTTNSIRVVESICQYDKRWRASLQYDRLEDLYVFPSSNAETPPPIGINTWEIPPTEILFSSEYADKWRLACQRDNETGYWYHCRYFALYNEYLLEFDLWNGEQSTTDTLTFGEITSMLRIIDDKMALYLGKK